MTSINKTAVITAMMSVVLPTEDESWSLRSGFWVQGWMDGDGCAPSTVTLGMFLSVAVVECEGTMLRAKNTGFFFSHKISFSALQFDTSKTNTRLASFSTYFLNKNDDFVRLS